MGAWKKPATETEIIFMKKLHKIMVSVTGIKKEDYCSGKRDIEHVRCRQIFAYNCHLHGIENIVMAQYLNRSHTAMNKYVEHYPRDYVSNYKDFRSYADAVSKELEKCNMGVRGV